MINGASIDDAHGQEEVVVAAVVAVAVAVVAVAAECPRALEEWRRLAAVSACLAK